MLAKKFAAPLILAVALGGGLVGCSSTKEKEAMNARLDGIAADAKAAAASAESAKASAAAAARAAAEAKAMAADAKSTAEATDEKLNRMFKKSMYK
ncbi:MAG: Lpp/OprI family alanine-zipper lipoprotein [Candidatus Macondimonas sp.]|jgi:murein lipoprotein